MLSPFFAFEERLLAEEAIAAYGFDALSILPDLIGDFVKEESNVAGRAFVATLAAVHRRLAWFNIILGEKDEAKRNLELSGAADPEGEAEALRRALARGERESRADSVNLLFVMRPPGAGGALSLGRVESVSANLRIAGEWSFFRKYDPELSIDGRILEQKDPFALQLADAVRFAERHFIDVLGKKTLARLPRHYSFFLPSGGADLSEAPAMTGGSAGLGFALLALALIDCLKTRPSSIRIRAAAAFTGSIGESGEILSVDDAGIEAKVRAAFFSPCRYLALPKGNRPRAEEMLRELEREHPARRLELVSHNSVVDLLSDERFVEHRTVSLAARLGASAFRKRKHLVTAAACAGTILVLALLLPPRYAREIARCEFRDNRLAFFNRFGVEFQSYTIPYHVNVRQNGVAPLADSTATLGRKMPCLPYTIVHEDILPGGGRELLFIGVESDPALTDPAGRIHVHLFSSHADSKLHVAIWDALWMLEDDKPSGYVQFELNACRLFDFDKDGSKELLLISRNHLWSPAAAIVISLEDGAYQTFRHNGHFYDYAIMDFNGDGADEIILAGVHNEPLRNSVVVVLDPRRIEGATPIGLNPRFIPPCNDAAMTYIKLPESIICSLLPEGECQQPQGVSVNKISAKEIWIGSQEGGNGRALMFYFDSSLSCVEVRCTDTYKAAYEGFRPQHNLKRLEEYLEDLRDEVEYWNGEGWRRRPAIRNIPRHGGISSAGGE